MSILRGCLLSILLLVSFDLLAQHPQAEPQTSTPAISQQQTQDGADAHNAALLKRKRTDALQLMNQHRYDEALPILEELILTDPQDRDLNLWLGISLVAESHRQTLPADRKRERARARTYLVKAQQLGSDNDLMKYYLLTIPEDGGSDEVFSDREEVNAAMQEGEAAFGRKDYQAAIKAYTQAMLLDPNLYTAVLFIGDSYFADGKYGAACEWFERTVKLDPNRESAYRYWGDALLRLNKMDEARTRYIDAMVAEPYAPRSRTGLQQWAKVENVQFNIIVIKSPNSVTLDGAKTNININPASLDKKDGSFAWMVYDLGKALWMRETFFKEFPEEKKYRHTLKEESQLLHMVANSVREEVKSDKQLKLDPALEMLVKIDDAGFLEPYILFFAADNGIAQDYAAYREAHRENLRRYLDEFVVPKTPKK